MKIRDDKTKALAYAAILLAICICSQFFKNMSVYITGPIINACLIIAVLTAGVWYASLLAVITPVTSFIITGSPVIAMVPLIVPFIMAGNEILVVFTHLFKNKSLPLGIGLGAAVKGAFMGVSIALIILPAMLPEKLMGSLAVFQQTFSITQFITAVSGGVLAYLIYVPLKKNIR